MAPPRSRPGRKDHAAIRRLADELLPALMARLEASPLGELEVRQDGWRVRLRKPAEAAVAPATTGRRRERTAGKTKADIPDGARGTANPGPRQDGRDPGRPAVTSPAVGTFHPQDETAVGQPVRTGDVVGHVEVLGVPQEVLAPFDGTLGRLLVEPGQVVEYGEPLMRIDVVGTDPGAREAGGDDPAGPRIEAS